MQDWVPGEARFRIVASQSAISPRDIDRACDATQLSAGATDFWSRWSAPGSSSASSSNLTASLTNGFESYTLGFDASWELDLWGKVRRSVESAQAQADASADQRRDALVPS